MLDYDIMTHAKRPTRSKIEGCRERGVVYHKFRQGTVDENNSIPTWPGISVFLVLITWDAYFSYYSYEKVLIVTGWV